MKKKILVGAASFALIVSGFIFALGSGATKADAEVMPEPVQKNCSCRENPENCTCQNCGRGKGIMDGESKRQGPKDGTGPRNGQGERPASCPFNQ